MDLGALEVLNELWEGNGGSRNSGQAGRTCGKVSWVAILTGTIGKEPSG